MPTARRQQQIEEAVRLLKTGDVVVFPTDTLFGLGADPFSSAAMRRVFDIKGRPSGMPISLLVSCWEQVNLLARQPPDAWNRLASVFWPGALTLVLPKASPHPRFADRRWGHRSGSNACP